jgi:hypothetical protein
MTQAITNSSYSSSSSSTLETTKFRRIPLAPALDTQRDRVEECDLTKGHILQFKPREGKIVCLNCPAEWKDEGF